jgi:hypothetical protein
VPLLAVLVHSHVRAAMASRMSSLVFVILSDRSSVISMVFWRRAPGLGWRLGRRLAGHSGRGPGPLPGLPESAVGAAAAGWWGAGLLGPEPRSLS